MNWAALRFAVTALTLLPAMGCSSPRPAADTGTGIVDDTGVPGELDANLGTETHLARGVTLLGLALFQGTRVALFDGGAPVAANAPIVADRAAVVRAYVDPGARAGQMLMGELEVRDGDRVLAVAHASATPTHASTDADPSSVLAFDVPAEAMVVSASFSVRLVDAAGDAPTGDHLARLPRDGSFHALGARSDGTGLHLVLVPLAWQNDGSGRTPDTSMQQLDRFRALLLALYPLVHIQIDVHAPISWSDALTLAGNVDFGSINGMLMDLRASDGAPDDAYYYALVNAAASYTAYCGGSCVTGQSFVVDHARDGDFRVGSGVGFSGENTAWTLAHEVGHEHGRSHAPCDTSTSDPAFPYGDGSIGVWGYDPRTHAFQDPTQQSDFMGYCDPTWTSDYTWSAIFERTVAVSALDATPRAPSLLVRVGGEVGARITGELALRAPHTRARVTGRWLDASGRSLAIVSAPALEQSHTTEQMAVFPTPPPDAVALFVNGRTLALDR